MVVEHSQRTGIRSPGIVRIKWSPETFVHPTETSIGLWGGGVRQRDRSRLYIKSLQVYCGRRMRERKHDQEASLTKGGGSVTELGVTQDATEGHF
ncbi:hypothetical protein Tco_0429677 [Tanacetum coccineum]